MPNFEVDSFLCVLELELGCKIISYIQIVLNVLLCIIVLATTIPSFAIVSIAVIGILTLAICCIGVGLGVLLLLGVKRGNERYVKLWVIIEAVVVVLNVVQLLVNIGSFSASGFVTGIIQILLGFYFIVVVNSYYKQMTSTK